MSKSQLKRVGAQGQQRIERLLQWLHDANLCASLPPARGYERRLIEFTVIDQCEAGAVYPKESLEVTMADVILLTSGLNALQDASKP